MKNIKTRILSLALTLALVIAAFAPTAAFAAELGTIQSAAWEYYVGDAAAPLTAVVSDVDRYAVEYKWLKDGIEVATGTIASGESSVTLEYTPDTSQAGEFRYNVAVSVSNPRGTTSLGGTRTVTVTVLEKPVAPSNGFKVSKVDQDGKPLAGAVIQLVGDDGNRNRYEATSQSDGYAEFSGVADGMYILSEKTAPAGYVKSDSTYYMNIDAGYIQIRVANTRDDYKAYKTVTFVNTKSETPPPVVDAPNVIDVLPPGDDAPNVVDALPPGDDVPNVVDVIGSEDTGDTAIAIAEEGWDTADTVVLASGEQAHLVDALAVSPLAFQKNAPILLVSGDTIAANVLAEIKRLGAKQVIAVGYVTDPELAHLRSNIPDITINLLRGANRIETAELIDAEFRKTDTPQGIFIVGYNGVPDAASASSFAAANRYIIKIADAQGNFSNGGGLSGYILGGPTLVRDIPGYPRLFGADRYATNLIVRNTLSYDFARIYVADGGDNLVNALTGSVLAAKFRAPLALMLRGDLSSVDFGSKVTTATQVYVIGQ